MLSTTRPVPEPAVLPPYFVRRGLAYPASMGAALLRLFLPQRQLPGSVKTLLALLLLFNWTQLPFVWHFRMFFTAWRFRKRALPYNSVLFPIKDRKAALTIPGVEPQLRLDQLPLGKSVFDDFTVLRFRAWPSECDWNMHLSNSSYNRALDYARMGHLFRVLVRSGSDGAFMALGGASYSYHREVPIGAKYDLEIGIYAWDEKWLYVIARFMEPAKIPSAVTRSKSAQNLKKLAQDALAGPRAPIEDLKTTQTSTPSDASITSGKRTVYCTAVSRYVFKAPSRRTIPPWIIIATSGYGSYASTRTNFQKAESLRRDVLAQAVRKNGGKPFSRDSFFRGGGYGRGGLLAQFHDATDRGEEWTKPDAWELGEFEAVNARNLANLKGTAGRFDL